MARVVVTGANRGIGFHLARETAMACAEQMDHASHEVPLCKLCRLIPFLFWSSLPDGRAILKGFPAT